MSRRRLQTNRPAPPGLAAGEQPEPNGSAQFRNWVLSIAAILTVLGAVFVWLDSSFDALDNRIDTVSERLTRIETQLEILLRSSGSIEPAEPAN